MNNFNANGSLTGAERKETTVEESALPAGGESTQTMINVSDDEGVEKSGMKNGDNESSEAEKGEESQSIENGENNSSESALPAAGENSQTMMNVSGDKEEGNKNFESGENNIFENANNQLALYDPVVNDGCEIVPVSDINASEPLRLQRKSFSHQTSRVLPSVGAFSVQCANCFKWRLIPTKEKYEEIREHILENPFVCEAAREWRPDASCDDDPDIEQDGSRLWAIDKPNIAQPPPGWQRLLRIRGEGSTKFADVYYEAPSGKRLRSMVEILRFLEEHPEYKNESVTMDRFSFQIPRPLQDNYVRKKRPAPSHGEKELGVKPIAWVDPDEDPDLSLGGPRQLACGDPLRVADYQPQKRQKAVSKRSYNGDSIGNPSNVKGESLQL